MSGPSDDWLKVPLGSVLTDIQPGFASGRHNSEGEGIPHFRPMNVSTDGRIDRSVLKYVDPAAGPTAIRLSFGDIVFNNTNSPELVGKTAFFDADDSPAFSNHMTRLRVDKSRLDPGYTALRLHQAWREGWFAAHCNNHVSQASIGRDVLKTFEIELPPLDMQRAIASLSAAVDDARFSALGHLTATRKLIEGLRQSVLAAACSGRLTTDWREEHPEAEATAPAETSGKKRRTAEMLALPLALPEMPDTYIVSTVGAAATVLEYGTSKKANNDALGVPVLRMGNIQRGRLEFDDLKYCPSDSEIERLVLLDGDLLFNRTNSPELVGKSAVFHEPAVMTFASYLIRVRFADDVADPDFVNYWLNSAWGRMWARHVKTDGVSQSNINGTKLGSMPLLLPPIEEQRVIVRRASQMLETADALLARVDRIARRVDRSSQAVLAKALRGELEVPAARDGGIE